MGKPNLAKLSFVAPRLGTKELLCPELWNSDEKEKTHWDNFGAYDGIPGSFLFSYHEKTEIGA